jgi:hypothetical protein
MICHCAHGNADGELALRTDERERESAKKHTSNPNILPPRNHAPACALHGSDRHSCTMLGPERWRMSSARFFPMILGNQQVQHKCSNGTFTKNGGNGS